jgi:hypothetical protein
MTDITTQALLLLLLTACGGPAFSVSATVDAGRDSSSHSDVGSSVDSAVADSIDSSVADVLDASVDSITVDSATALVDSAIGLDSFVVPPDTAVAPDTAPTADTAPPCATTLCGATCVDTQDDPNNCGTCNTTCSGTCALGRCLVQLSMGAVGPSSIAIGGGNVFYGTNSLMSVPVAGGSTNTVATGFSFSGLGIAANSSTVYWAASTPSWAGIYSAPPLQKFVTQPNSGVSAIAVDAIAVYWLNGNTVNSTTLAGVTTTITLPQGTEALYLAIDDFNIYWANNGGQGPYTIQSVPKIGGAPATIFTGNYAQGLASDGTYVYWTSPADGTVEKMLATGAVPTVLATATDNPSGIVVSDGFVYWTNSPISGTGTGSIMKVPTTGGAPTTLALGQNPGPNLVVDATSAYWFNWPAPSGVVKVTPR